MTQNKPASTIKRIIAYFIDLSLCYFVVFIGVLIYISMFRQQNLFNLNFNENFDEIVKYTSLVGRVMIVALPMYLFCFEYTQWHATPGKKLFNLKVVDTKRKKLSLYKVVFRVLLFRLLKIISFILFSFYSKHEIYIVVRSLMIPSLENIKLLITTVPEHAVLRLLFIIWFMPIIFTKNKMGVYELLSGTRVVRNTDRT